MQKINAGKEQLLLASPISCVSDYWMNVLGSYSVHVISQTKELSPARLGNSVIKPVLTLCDARMFAAGPDSDANAKTLSYLGSIAPIILMVDEDPDAMSLDWLQYGVRGCCSLRPDGAMLRKAVATVLKGEAWLSRRLIGRAVTQFSSVQDTPLAEEDVCLDLLSARELEVARLVTEGMNNKLIARQLDVTERTIKAHLSKIFQKLDIGSRLMLAMTLKNRF